MIDDQEKLNAVYKERDMCISLIVKMANALGMKTGTLAHVGEGRRPQEWDTEWLNVIFVDLPSGQVSWHIHDSELPFFEGITEYAGQWDGHDTATKYQRVLHPALTDTQIKK